MDIARDDDGTVAREVGTVVAAARPERRRRRHSSRTLRVWVLVGLGIAVVGAGIVAWTSGLVDPSVEPRALLLRQKIDTTSRPAVAPPPALPAAAPARVVAPMAPAPPGSAGTPAPAAPPASTPSTPSGRAAAPPASRPLSPGVTSGAATPATEASTSAPSASVGSSKAASSQQGQAPAPVAAAGPGTAPVSARFAVELGPFFTAAEAERVERRLVDAGYPTVRFRQQMGTTVYAVLVERVPPARDAQALVGTLREQGFPEPAVLGTTEPPSVRVGDPVPLRAAVQLAERLRGAGHQVRVAARAGEAITFMIRHGNFTSLAEAEAKSQELARLGLATQPVQVK
jgi:hypothetical protein